MKKQSMFTRDILSKPDPLCYSNIKDLNYYLGYEHDARRWYDLEGLRLTDNNVLK